MERSTNKEEAAEARKGRRPEGENEESVCSASKKPRRVRPETTQMDATPNKSKRAQRARRVEVKRQKREVKRMEVESGEVSGNASRGPKTGRQR